MSASCFADVLSELVDLTQAERGALERLEERQRQVRRGALLQRENEAAGELFILRKGVVMSYVLLDDGSRQILRFLFPGDMLGVSSAIYREALHDAADGVRRGELLSQNFSRRSEYFFPLVAEMVAVGEVTGKLSDMLSRVAGFYKREIETTTANLVELIQPIIIVVIGILVGLLFASVLFPIYNLVQRGF